MTYIVNNAAIIIVRESGETLRIEKTNPIYPMILTVFSLPKEEQEEKLTSILNPQPKVRPTVDVLKDSSEFVVTDDTVYYEGEELPQPLVQKVLSIIRDGLPVTHFKNFWVRLRENPSQVAVNELIDFLSYRELPLTEDGCFIAYKGVSNDLWSIHGNTKTKVLQGQVDSSGRIHNPIGATIEVSRRCVDDDRRNECSEGLHVGSKDYATGWGAKTVVVKVDPRDVVSVPKDCEFQKCRVSKYVVVDNYTEEIETSVVDEDGKDTLIQKEYGVDRGGIISHIEAYLSRKSYAGVSQVTVRQIQNSFTPSWQTKEVVLDALQTLEYDFDEVDGVWIVNL